MIHVIENDDVYREFMAEMIYSFGFSVREFDSGETYLQYLQDGQYRCPKAIFSDMNMGTTTGLEMLDKVLKRYPDIPCYIITGLPDQLTTADLEKVAIREVVAKPVTFGKISEILKSLSA